MQFEKLNLMSMTGLCNGISLSLISNLNNFDMWVFVTFITVNVFLFS